MTAFCSAKRRDGPHCLAYRIKNKAPVGPTDVQAVQAFSAKQEKKASHTSFQKRAESIGEQYKLSARGSSTSLRISIH